MSARTGLVLGAFLALAALRLPAVVQPAGGDQGLYAYVGQRILAGELPYRDAWDQKPPAIHFAYAAMQAVWSDLRVVAVTDWLLALVTTAAARCARGGPSAYGAVASPRACCSSASPIPCSAGSAGCGCARSARSSSPRSSRSPCSPRGKPWPTGRLRDAAGRHWRASASASRSRSSTTPRPTVCRRCSCSPSARREAGAGRPRPRWQPAQRCPRWACSPCSRPVGPSTTSYHATYTYNLLYSGETYRGAWHFLSYLVTFPIGYAWIDSLWWLGGLASAALLLAVVPLASPAGGARVGGGGVPVDRDQREPWTAAVLRPGLAGPRAGGGSRPRHAVATGLARAATVSSCSLVAIGIWRVTPLPKAADYWWHDVRYISGDLPRTSTWRDSAGAPRATSTRHWRSTSWRTTSRRTRVRPTASWSSGSRRRRWWTAQRVSATRFFWSRPVIVGFREGEPGYGATGHAAGTRAHATLRRRAPAS